MTSMPNEPVGLNITSCPAHLPVVRGAIEKACEQCGLDAEDTGAVVLSVDEALANIIKHAYQGERGHPIEIELSPISDGSDSGLQIRIRDHGMHVDPAEIKSRDLKDVRPGGLGVHIMTKCMDSVEFSPGEGGGTLLTMRKWATDPSTRQETTA